MKAAVESSFPIVGRNDGTWEAWCEGTGEIGQEMGQDPTHRQPVPQCQLRWHTRLKSHSANCSLGPPTETSLAWEIFSFESW